MRLDGKVSVITGGGSGMGRVAAQLFAAEGAHVVVAEYNEAAGAETVDLVRAAGGVATLIRADVSKEADARGMVDHAVAHRSSSTAESASTTSSRGEAIP